MQNIRSVRGVRKEINYSESCSNAADKAQLSLGCTHLNTRSLRSLVLKWVQPKLSCALSWAFEHGPEFYFLILTPLLVLFLICLYISSRALSKAFEHRNFVARYQRETNHITVTKVASLVTMDASLQYWSKHSYT